MSLLLDLLDAAYDARHWNGVNLRRALRGVTARQAAWSPGRGRPSIWGLVLHCAYWKHTVRRRVSGQDIGDFARSPANFPALPKRPTAAAWRADLALLDAEHRALRRVVERMAPARLNRTSRGRWRNIEQIHGVAGHDIYHTGQIQLLKKLSAARRS